jgi:hypothetical protein
MNGRKSNNDWKFVAATHGNQFAALGPSIGTGAAKLCLAVGTTK